MAQQTCFCFEWKTDLISFSLFFFLSFFNFLSIGEGFFLLLLIFFLSDNTFFLFLYCMLAYGVEGMFNWILVSIFLFD